MANGIPMIQAPKPVPWRSGSISSTTTSMDASGGREALWILSF
jgi:hypothetical protein